MAEQFSPFDPHPLAPRCPIVAFDLSELGYEMFPERVSRSEHLTTANYQPEAEATGTLTD